MSSFDKPAPDSASTATALYKFIYCQNCGISEYIVDELPAWGVNTHAAQDLVCKQCHLVIATLHESQSPMLPTATVRMLNAVAEGQQSGKLGEKA